MGNFEDLNPLELLLVKIVSKDPWAKLSISLPTHKETGITNRQLFGRADAMPGEVISTSTFSTHSSIQKILYSRELSSFVERDIDKLVRMSRFGDFHLRQWAQTFHRFYLDCDSDLSHFLDKSLEPNLLFRMLDLIFMQDARDTSALMEMLGFIKSDGKFDKVKYKRVTRILKKLSELGYITEYGDRKKKTKITFSPSETYLGATLLNNVLYPCRIYTKDVSAQPFNQKKYLQELKERAHNHGNKVIAVYTTNDALFAELRHLTEHCKDRHIWISYTVERGYDDRADVQIVDASSSSSRLDSMPKDSLVLLSDRSVAMTAPSNHGVNTFWLNPSTIASSVFSRELFYVIQHLATHKNTSPMYRGHSF